MSDATSTTERTEVLARKAHARCHAPGSPLSFAEGTLSIDNSALAWKRDKINVFRMGPRDFHLALKDMHGCSVRGSALVVETQAGAYRFLIVKARLWPPAWWYSNQTAEEWKADIDRLIGHSDLTLATVEHLRSFDVKVLVFCIAFAAFATLCVVGSAAISPLPWYFFAGTLVLFLLTVGTLAYGLWKLRREH